MKLVASAFGLALVVFSTGCPLVEVEAEVPEACMVQHDIQVEGVSPDMANHISSTFTFDDLSGFDKLKDYDPSMHFTSATITATNGVADLAFISDAKVDVASGDPDSSLPTKTFYQCVGGDCPTDGKAMDIPVTATDDIAAYINTGSLAIALDADGHMPTQAWTMDATLCVDGSASYSK
jgi:hypothetical protein